MNDAISTFLCIADLGNLEAKCIFDSDEPGAGGHLQFGVESAADFGQSDYRTGRFPCLRKSKMFCRQNKKKLKKETFEFAESGGGMSNRFI